MNEGILGELSFFFFFNWNIKFSIITAVLPHTFFFLKCKSFNITIMKLFQSSTCDHLGISIG